MKNRFILGTCFLASIFLLFSCDAGFDDMNRDKTNLTSVDPGLLVNTAIVNSALNMYNLFCETTIVRQGITPFTGILTCANINEDNKSATSQNWNRYYGPNVIRELTDAILRTEPDDNVHHIARIWRAHSVMVATDSYGDVPYSEAGLAYLEGVVFPSYDPQEEIYTGPNGILAELADAAASLDPSKPGIENDVFYQGDVNRWKRLGYSLLLRAAMRLTKVKPDLAEQYAKVAFQGGVMQSNDDNAVIRHTPDFRNPTGNAMSGSEAANYYLDEYFVEWMRGNNDPRLGAIAVRYVGAESGTGQTEAVADRNPANQVGMPQGYDANTLVPVLEAAGLASLYDYSQIDRTTFNAPQAPTFLVTYAQTQLLLAEAAHRNWISGDPEVLYLSGIEAHMQQLAEYGPNAEISQADITAYLQANPLNAGSELEQINTQYWAASFMNGPEAWANFRRSGYPDLDPNPLSGHLQSEEFIRRFTYPDSEYSVNEENMQAAISRQGPDLLDTRIWWDVK